MPQASKSSGTKTKKLVLLDAHAVIHRAYHALPEFATSSGEPTGALYGLCTMLMKLIGDLKPDYIVACFDLPGPTHRHEAYAAYKGTRRALDDNLSLQLDRARDIFKAWGIPIYSKPGFEADDIIGTIVEETRGLQTGNVPVEVVIASGDMDTLQLVEGKRVKVYTLKKGLNDTVTYDEKAVKQRFGFGPALLPDYKGLRGDPSDNIIGVKGIGEKTATNLITAFGTIENIYKNLKKSGPRFAEALAKAGISERVKTLLLENEEEAIFSKTLATIRRDAPIDFSLPPPWRECLDLDVLLDLFQKLEFRTLGERVKKLVAGTTTTLTNQTEPPKQTAAEEDKALELALWVVDSNLTDPTMEDVFRFTRASTADAAWKAINTELDKRGVRSVFEEIEEPLMAVVERLNGHGILVDRQKLESLSREYGTELHRLEQSIWQETGVEFNIASPRQLGEVLFDRLGLGESRQKKTASGSFSTKESELEKLIDKHPAVKLVLSYRELAKLLGTYIDTIPRLLDAEGRLHSRFVQAGTTTGRMASLEPNLQNIPVKTALGRAIREAFVAPPGSHLLSLDYSQIELRIAAILSGDRKFVDIFKKGEDVHAGVAAEIFGKPIDEVSKEERRRAKTINFGILYGMGVNALRQNLGTDRRMAQEFYNNYFATFAELAAYLDAVKADAARQGYTTTMFGRRRYFQGFQSPLPYVRAQAERMAVNAPIQGTEADIVKIAMKRIDDCIERNGWRGAVELVLQVHDEMVYEIRDDLVEVAAAEFKMIMSEVIPAEKRRGVPIVAESGAATHWGDAH